MQNVECDDVRRMIEEANYHESLNMKDLIVRFDIDTKLKTEIGKNEF